MNASKTIPSGNGYGYEYEVVDPLHIARRGSNHTYAKQLEKDGCAWFSNLEECDENASTVICAIAEDGSLSWLSDNIHATNSLLEELDEIREFGGRLSYISSDAIRYIIETEGLK